MFQMDDDLQKEIELRDYSLNFAKRVSWDSFMYLGKKKIPSNGHVCGKTTDEVRYDIHVQAKIPQKTLTQFQKF